MYPKKPWKGEYWSTLGMNKSGKKKKKPEGRREGGKEGRREGGKEGRRVGGNKGLNHKT